MATAVTLIVIGLVIGFAAFCLAAVNMYRGVSNPDESYGFATMFKRHIGAMIGMAFGGLVVAIGIIVAIVHYVG